MLEYSPSRTALAAAAHRATHQLVDDGCVFSDPWAVAILGNETPLSPELVARASLRFFIACRSRVAEVALADAVSRRAVSQAVVLGAGLDTFALRNPHPTLR